MYLRGDQTKDRRIGVWLTNDLKETMKRETHALLDTNRMHFSSDFVSSDLGMKGTICNQLRNYKYELLPGKTVFSKPKMTMTGKSYNSSDDLCIVVQMLVLWPPVYYEHPNSVSRITPD
jgi:hypothetical protein